MLKQKSMIPEEKPRKTKLNDQQKSMASNLKGQGHSLQDIAALYKVSRTTIGRACGKKY
jgi:hypothetical protein